MSTADFARRQRFHDLYSDHHGWLLGWLRRQLGCPHQAADVAQNTFVRVLQVRDALCGVDEPRAWLTTTARRLIIDEARHRRIEQAYLEALGHLGVGQEGHPSPEETLAAVQALAQLSAVLEGVSAKAREAFMRHYLDGETHAEVAGALAVSARMVRKYLAQVLVRACALGLHP